MALEVVILAAGKGARMRSSLPKVLHRLAGKPLLAYVLQTANALNPSKIHVVIGHESKAVKAVIENMDFQTPINWVNQSVQAGTGHAVAQVLPSTDPESTILIMAGDVPLIRPATLQPLCNVNTGIHLLTADVVDASGYGRIERDQDNNVVSIIEDKDANEKQKTITEFNTGFLVAKTKQLGSWLSRVNNANAQNEYYLPDVIPLAIEDGERITTFSISDISQVLGVNSRVQLSQLERLYQESQAKDLMALGVSLADPARIDIRGKLKVGRDCFIDINAVFKQTVVLGDGVVIEPNVLIRNSRIGDGCVIKANSVIDNAVIEANCEIGPFARIRPQTHLSPNCRVGNFVEIKKSTIASDSKVNHLSYVGDSIIGKRVNIGAGVITCNYDGANKHQTHIGDDVFVGSGCQLVAPVVLGDGATIGAGTTLRKNAPAHTLNLGKAKDIQMDDWARPKKK